MDKEIKKLRLFADRMVSRRRALGKRIGKLERMLQGAKRPDVKASIELMLSQAKEERRNCINKERWAERLIEQKSGKAFNTENELRHRPFQKLAELVRA